MSDPAPTPQPPPEDLARRLQGLLPGRTNYYGQAQIVSDTADYVWRRTEKNGEPLSLDHYRAHLYGGPSLGVRPHLEDDTAVFGAIDFDTRGLSREQLIALEERVETPPLPEGATLVVCRSKSGGAHLLLLLEEPAPVEKVRGYLQAAAKALELGLKVEVFPYPLLFMTGE